MTRATKNGISSRDKLGPLHASTPNLPSHIGSIRGIADGFDMTLFKSIVSGDISDICYAYYNSNTVSSIQDVSPLCHAFPAYFLKRTS